MANVITMTKICTKCGKELPLSEFSHKRPKGRKPGLQPRCKLCSKEDTKNWREEQSEDRIRDLYYKRTYGLSLQDFNSLFSEQKGKCKICDRDLSLVHLSGDRAVVDHCHTTGKVRGILCNECNRGLGYFRDNVESLMNAVNYLTETGQSSEGGQ